MRRTDYATIAARYDENQVGHRIAVDDALAELVAPGGALRVVNLVPERCREGWRYKFFPAAVDIDAARFPAIADVTGWLEQAGLEAVVHVEWTRSRVQLARALEDAERPDASSLAILEDAEFADGLARMRREVAKSPTGRVVDESAVATWTARFAA